MSEEIKQKVEKVRKEKEHAQPTASAILADGSLAEMVYRPEENRTTFCVSKDASLRYEPNLLAGGQRLVPYSPGNNLLRNEVVLFPLEAAEYESEQIGHMMANMFTSTLLPKVSPPSTACKSKIIRWNASPA